MSAVCGCGAAFSDYGSARNHYWDQQTAGEPHVAWTIPSSWMTGRPWGLDAFFGGQAKDGDDKGAFRLAWGPAS